MIVSGESKTGQTHSRARSRRRVGEATARPCEAVVTDNPMPRVMAPSRPREAVVVNLLPSRGMTSAPIVVDDEDDDVVVSSPRAFAHAISIANGNGRVTRQSRVPVPVEDDLLELRLGPGGTSRSVSQSSATEQQPRHGRRGRPGNSTIDLTTPSRQAPVIEDCVVLGDNPRTKKRKNLPLEQFFVKEVSPISPAQEREEEHKLRCAICMDTMKEETSTICGHIFCLTCIQGAIKTQKKCPTCRKKLTKKNIHRIYI